MRRWGAIPTSSDEAQRFAIGLICQRDRVCYHPSNALATLHAKRGALPITPAKNKAHEPTR